MVSESQERMLIITDKKKLKKLEEICKKFRIKCSVLGQVTQKKMMKVNFLPHLHLAKTAGRLYPHRLQHSG